MLGPQTPRRNRGQQQSCGGKLRISDYSTTPLFLSAAASCMFCTADFNFRPPLKHRSRKNGASTPDPGIVDTKHTHTQCPAARPPKTDGSCCKAVGPAFGFRPDHDLQGSTLTQREPHCLQTDPPTTDYLTPHLTQCHSVTQIINAPLEQQVDLLACLLYRYMEPLGKRLMSTSHELQFINKRFLSFL